MGATGWGDSGQTLVESVYTIRAGSLGHVGWGGVWPTLRRGLSRAEAGLGSEQGRGSRRERGTDWRGAWSCLSSGQYTLSLLSLPFPPKGCRFSHGSVAVFPWLPGQPIWELEETLGAAPAGRTVSSASPQLHLPDSPPPWGLMLLGIGAVLSVQWPLRLSQGTGWLWQAKHSLWLGFCLTAASTACFQP